MDTKPLEFLKLEMSRESNKDRINAIHRTPIIASLMGSERIKNELLPYF